MRTKTTNKLAECFKCGKQRKPRYGVWAFQVPATASKPPKGEEVAEELATTAFSAFGGIGLAIVGGVSGLGVGDLDDAEPISALGGKIVAKVGKKLLNLGKDDTVRKKVYRRKTIKAPKFQTGGMIYRLFDSRNKWMCDGPAYEGQDHKINRRFKKKSKLQKALERTLFGKKTHRKRSVKFVCLDCFKTLTGEYPTPGRQIQVRVLPRRIDQIKKTERGALGRTRTKAV